MPGVTTTVIHKQPPTRINREWFGGGEGNVERGVHSKGKGASSSTSYDASKIL